MSILSRTPFGTLTIEALLAADELKNIGRRSSRWQVLEAFLRHSEGRAERIYEGTSGLIIMVGIPGQPNTGAFYLYDETNRHFFTLTFEEKDLFHASVFDYVVQFYDLGQYVEIPRLRLVEKKAPADKGSVASVPQNKANYNRKKFYKRRQHRVTQAVVQGTGPVVGQVATA